MDAISIRKVVEKVSNGTIRIPAFQRGFVWDADRVAFLMDSIYKGYPFGATIIWRTKTPLQTERNLGPFELPEPEAGYPIDYVLDGQQRLTSIFGVFQYELAPIEGERADWTRIFFDLSAKEDLQESQFVALPDDEVDPQIHFPIGSFFKTLEYRDATKALEPDIQAKVDEVQAKFKEATVPFQLIETDDRAKVAIVFERVNRLGVELDILQLLSAWTWSEEFDLQERFQELADEVRPFGFGGVGEDSNLLLRCCSAVIGDDASSSGLLALNGGEVRDRFDEISNGIQGAIEFLRRHLKVQQLKNLPYPTLLVPLAAFFAAENGKEPSYTQAQYDELLRWFWKSCFTRRFSAGVLAKLNRDIKEAKRLRADEESGLADINCSISKDFFIDTTFTIGSVNTSTFLLLLAQFDPRSFVSGSPTSLESALRSYNRTEFHHCYPQKYLKGKGYSSEGINRLANFVFLTRADNRKLGGVAPSEYRKRMVEADLDEVLGSALCPGSLFSDDYEVFLDERSELLKRAAESLI
ncbi:MAG: GmrSD restriction endonuclease domain-containing protein [Acidimicrobiales bacterium]